jgi:hypothetical protein
MKDQRPDTQQGDIEESKPNSNLHILPKRYRVKYPDKEYIEKLSAILNSDDFLFIIAIKNSIDIFYEKLSSNTKIK